MTRPLGSRRGGEQLPIVYVSCNPATFARDADWLSRHGWRLTRLRPVDLFPQTHHVETVGLFLRGQPTHRR